MDFAKLVELFLRHPWMVSGALVLLLGTVMVLGFRLWGSRRRRAWALLRPEREQVRFEPLGTVYEPRRFRKREPRQ